MDRANDFMTQRGSQLIRRPVPLNVAIPLFEAASLEEDDDLQDLWATRAREDKREAASAKWHAKSYVRYLETKMDDP